MAQSATASATASTGTSPGKSTTPRTPHPSTSPNTSVDKNGDIPPPKLPKDFPKKPTNERKQSDNPLSPTSKLPAVIIEEDEGSQGKDRNQKISNLSEQLKSSSIEPSVASPSNGRRASWLHSLGSKISSTLSQQQLLSPTSNTTSNFSNSGHVFNAYSLSYEHPSVTMDPPKTSSPKLSTTSASPVVPEMSKSPEMARSGSLMTRLRRMSNRSVPFGLVASPERMVLNRNPAKKQSKVPEFEGVLCPRVSFGVTLFEQDPPQQIPSRNPAKGNVVIQNGEVLKGLGSYATLTHAASQSAYESAIRVAQSVRSGSSGSGAAGASLFRSKSNSQSCDHDDGSGALPYKGLKIDTPIHTGATNAFGIKKSSESNNGLSTSTSSTEDDEKSTGGLTAESLYTRCCHLREILPIPATLKQIKGQDIPLMMLKLMNPRPTLIEVLSLADFLSVCPLLVLILDNCSLSNEMLKIIFCGLTHSIHLTKLSLRDVPLDEIGWKLLCAYISDNQGLIKLDLSVQRTSSKKLDRSTLDWTLLTKALKAQGNIEELLLNGCMIPSDELEDLLLNGCTVATKRLGLAANDLHHDDLLNIRNWVLDSRCERHGLDLGGNDLDSSWLAFKEIVMGPSLMFLSLNSTNLHHVEHTAEMLGQLVKNSPNLNFLDLSGNKELFPDIIPDLANILPKFKQLHRVHLESNDLSSDDVVMLSEAFGECPRLVHISLLDNTRLDCTACAALTVAAQLSNSLYTIECDPGLWSPALQRRLSQFCMRNVARSLGASVGADDDDDEDESSYDKKDLVDSGSGLAKAVEDMLNRAPDEKGYSILTEKLVKTARQLKTIVKKTTDSLFAQRNENSLSIEDKEGLVRLCFVDNVLEKVIYRYEQHMKGLPIHDKAHFSYHLMSLGAPPPHVGSPTTDDTQGQSSIHPDLQISAVDDSHVGSLSRQSSSSSLHRREQEQEEGEVLKLARILQDKRVDSDSSEVQQALARGVEILQGNGTEADMEKLDMLISDLAKTMSGESEGNPATSESEQNQQTEEPKKCSVL